MKEQWQSRSLAKNWVAAQGKFGDAWRLHLVNPVVLRMCESMVFDATLRSVFEFSVFDALESASRDESLIASTRRHLPKQRIAGVTVVDLGCGDGCLGSFVTTQGAKYVGFDSSRSLVRSAGNRGLRDVHVLDLEADEAADDWNRLEAKLADIVDSPCLLTSVIVLDHLEKPERFLGWLGCFLGKLSHDVPVLIVTLESARFDFKEEMQRGSLDGGVSYRLTARIESIESGKNEVNVRVRSQREYERLFRDSSLLVRATDPLHFILGQPSIPTEYTCVSRLPTFRAWRLTARRQFLSDTRELLQQFSSLLETKIPGLYAQFSAEEGFTTRLKFFRLAREAPLVLSQNLGGELFVVLEGTAHLKGGATGIAFGPGDILGELEAAGHRISTHFVADVRAGESGCLVGVIHPLDLDRALARERSFGDVLYRSLRDRLQLLIWKHGTDEVHGESWSDQVVLSDSGESRTVAPQNADDQALPLHGPRRRIMVPEFLAGVAPQYIVRAARALVWCAAIERRSRTAYLPDDIAFFNTASIHESFHPGVKRPDEMKAAFRLFRDLRLLDAFNGSDVLGDEKVDPHLGISPEAYVRQRWIEALEIATSRILDEHTAERGSPLRFLKDSEISRMGLGVTPSLWKGNGAPSNHLEMLAKEMQSRIRETAAAKSAIERWKLYIARTCRIWTDQNSFPFVYVLRELQVLQKVALGNMETLRKTLIDRANYIGETPVRKNYWLETYRQSSSTSRLAYVDAVVRFLGMDLEASQCLRYSDGMQDWKPDSQGTSQGIIDRPTTGTA